MKIEKIYDQGSDKINEDRLLVKDNLFVVFDGVTGLIEFTDQKGKSGGWLAADIAKETFASNDRPLDKLAESANGRIKEAMLSNKVAIEQKENLWGTGFAAVRINSGKLEWAQIADCLILLINKGGSFQMPIKGYDHDGEVLGKWKKLGNISRAEKRKILTDDMIKMRRDQCIKYGFLNGEKEYLKFLNQGTADLKDLSQVVIFTDGLILPKENPEADDNFDEFAENYLEGGLKQVRDRVRSMENQDPKCQEFPRYKTHDDIAAIAITL